MSVREVNQRWLATMGLDDESIRLREWLKQNIPSGEQITGMPRPPWWRPFARRRWDRTVAMGLKMWAESTVNAYAARKLLP